MARKDEKRRRVTPDAMRQNAAMSGGGRNLLKLPKGVGEWEGPDKAATYNIDFLPYEVSTDQHPDRVEKGMIWWKFPFFAYQGIGVNQEWIVSPASIGLPCPITEHRNKLAQDWDKNEAALKALAQKKHVLYAMKDPKDKDKVLLWAFSQFKFGDAMDEEIKNTKEENLNFYDVKGGKTIAARFSEEKYEGRAYLKATRIDFLDRKDMDEAEILAKVPALEKCLNILPYDTIKAIFLGVESGEDDSANPPNSGGGGQSPPTPKSSATGTPAGKSGKPTPKPAAAPAGDEESEDGDEAPAFAVGDWVAGTSDADEPVAGEVITVSSDRNDIEVKDVNGSTYDCAASALEKTDPPASKKKGKAATTAPAPKAKGGGAKKFENAAGLEFGVGDTVEDGEGATGVITEIDEANEDATCKPKKGAEFTLDWDDIKKVVGGAAEEPEEEEEDEEDAYVPAVGDQVEWDEGKSQMAEGEILKLRASDNKAKVKTAAGPVWVDVAALSEKD